MEPIRPLDFFRIHNDFNEFLKVLKSSRDRHYKHDGISYDLEIEILKSVFGDIRDLLNRADTSKLIDGSNSELVQFYIDIVAAAAGKIAGRVDLIFVNPSVSRDGRAILLGQDRALAWRYHCVLDYAVDVLKRSSILLIDEKTLVDNFDYITDCLFKRFYTNAFLDHLVRDGVKKCFRILVNSSV